MLFVALGLVGRALVLLCIAFSTLLCARVFVPPRPYVLDDFMFTA